MNLSRENHSIIHLLQGVDGIIKLIMSDDVSEMARLRVRECLGKKVGSYRVGLIRSERRVGRS